MKIYKVSWCADCPNYDSFGYKGKAWCSELTKPIDRPTDDKLFPNNCPLEDLNEKKKRTADSSTG